MVLSIQDIYPEAAIELGKLPSSGVVPNLLKNIDRQIAHQATVLLTVSENFAQFYANTRKVPLKKIHVIYNWMDEEEIKPGFRLGKFRQMQKISKDTFVIMYCGNVGINAGVEFIVEAAAKLQDNKVVMFVIAGDGSCRSMCESMAKDYGLTNVRFFYPLSREEFSDVQASADLMLLTTRKAGSLTSVPSKLIAYMLSGRPVLATVDANSDTARIIREAECGLSIEPENSEMMADHIRKLIEVPEELNRMGKRGRHYAEKHFSRKTCVPKLIDIIESVVSDINH